MVIRFLRDCDAPQTKTHYCCDICGWIPGDKEWTPFFKDDEVNPEIMNEEIDLSGLTYKEDYEILEYP
jgi:hypothetical protein